MAVSTDLADLRVLLVQAPGADATRIAVEAVLVEAGGDFALTPAAANVLLVCGRLPERMRELADGLWEQVPHPRVRLETADAADAERILASATESLRDLPAQRAAAERDARSRPTTTGHEGHEGMDMSGHGGIPLASGDEDRDGLEMDVLNRTLGPVLPFWDPRILVRIVLAGDTIRSAEVELTASDPAVSGSDTVLRLDGVVRFLRLAGWDALGDRLTRARNAALRGRTDAALRDTVAARRRIRRSAILRWTLRGLAVGERPLRELLLDRLEEAILLLRGETPAATVPLLGTEELAALITGHDLGTARLLLAAVEPDLAPADSSATPAPSGHAAASGGHHHG